MDAAAAEMSPAPRRDEGQRLRSVSDLLTTMTRKQLRVAVQAGRLHRVVRGVYSTGEPDDMTMLRALHDHRGLVFTGHTAMGLHDNTPVEWPVSARHDGPGRRTRQAVIRSGVPSNLRKVHGLTVVSPLQAVVDADRPDDELKDFLTRMYRGHRIGAELEKDVAALVNARGRACLLLAGTPTGTASRLEQDAFMIVREALDGLPVSVLTNQIVGNYCYDLVIPEARLAIEIDSYMFHAGGGVGTTVGSFVKDAWKGNEIAHLDWLCLRYTNYCIAEAPDLVGRDVRRHVEVRRRRQGVALPPAIEDPIWVRHPAGNR
ncbi:hypothetical protein A606_03420 [Corynebacterium terpenotabidum Y-11]|uniref:DUF559 domain-containing protein n=1 Tax=Corynebacterium terpenotabidum Y-11 TaxID=1200352 RepID=S4XFD6_9CORY|nr:hypothetical protein A606_03420 [Corynebacterium terpenotabidum Y-11]